MIEPFKNILVYVDGTESSISAAMAAIVLAKRLGASLTAIYVVNTKALQELVNARIFLEFEKVEYSRILKKMPSVLNHAKELATQKESK